MEFADPSRVLALLRARVRKPAEPLAYGLFGLGKFR